MWAALVFRIGEFREAEQIFRQAISGMRKGVRDGTIKPKVLVDALSNFAHLRRTKSDPREADQGKFEEALETAREAVESSRRAGRTDTPDFGLESTVLGGFLTEKGTFGKADAALREAERIYRKLLSPDHLWPGDYLRNQASSFYQQGKFTAALPMVMEALNICRDSFANFKASQGDQNPRTKMAKYRVAELCRAWHKAAMAQGYLN